MKSHRDCAARAYPWLVLSLASLLGISSARAETLNLEGYLKQVREGSQGVRGSLEAAQGSESRARESQLLVAPSLFAEARLSSDGKPSFIPSFVYDKLITNGYSVGFQQNTTYGLQWKLAYNLTYTDYAGLNLGGAPTSYYEGRPQLDLTYSLWRNQFGKEVQAQQEAAEATALATSYGKRMEAKAQLAEAEGTYWALALARESVKISEETLARAEKVLNWNKRRASLQLAENADLLQAQATFEARKLQLQAALDGEKASARAFNLSRGRSGEVVSEDLEPLTVDRVNLVSAPARSGNRDDVKAAEQMQRAMVAQAEQGLWRDRPTLDVFGSVALNSRELTQGDAVSNSFKDTHPTTAVGLKFNLPLYFGVTYASRDGWRSERDAAERTYQHKLLQQEQEWTQLNQQLGESKARLAQSAKIEEAQRARAEAERDRLSRGRATTFQSLLAEEDYAQARLGRLRAEAEVLGLAARMKTFTESL